MDMACESLCKRREIAFCTLHPDPEQAHSAVAFLTDIQGIDRVEVLHKAAIEVHYRLVAITLADIESLLEDRGFHLDNRLVYKIKRALYHYSEDTQRANLGCAKGDPNCTEKVFVNRYRKRDHGCQDDRPEHWRRYL